jgi:hypothetical protein
MEVVVHDNHIDFEIARLWRFDTYQEARAFEHKLKRAGHAPRYCPICQHKPLDADTLLYYGHWPLALHDKQGRRQPMGKQHTGIWIYNQFNK